MGRIAGASLGVLVVVVACGCSAPAGEVASDEGVADTASEAIVNGDPDATYDEAVYLVAPAEPGFPKGQGCTGTLVSPSLVITARHCEQFSLAPSRTGFVRTGVFAQTLPLDTARVFRGTLNPACQDTQPSCSNLAPGEEGHQTDVQVVQINRRLTNNAVAHIRFEPESGPDLSGFVGEPVVLPGYGNLDCELDPQRSFRRRRLSDAFVAAIDLNATPWTALETDHRFGIDARSPTGRAALGDSGGGWFVTERDGSHSIIATTQGACGGVESQIAAIGPILGGPKNRQWLEQTLNPDGHRLPCDADSVEAELRGRDAIGTCPVYLGEQDGVPFNVYPDADGDGISDTPLRDNCPASACNNPFECFNPDQLDSDVDGIGDVCDNCVDVFNDTQGNCNLEAELELGEDPRGDACDPDPCVQVAAQQTALPQGPLPSNPDITANAALPHAPFPARYSPSVFLPRDGRVAFRHCACSAPHATAALRRANCQDPQFECLIGDGGAIRSLNAGWQRMSFPAAPVPRDDFEFLRNFDAAGKSPVTWQFLSDLSKFGATFIDPIDDFGAFSAEVARLDGVSATTVTSYEDTVGAGPLPITTPRWNRVNHYVAHDINPFPSVLAELPPFGPGCRVPCYLDLPGPDVVGRGLIAPWLRFGGSGLVVQKPGVAYAASLRLTPSVIAALEAVDASRAVVWASEPASLLQALGVALRGVVVDRATFMPLSTLQLDGAGELQAVPATVPPTCGAGQLLMECDTGMRCSSPCDGVVGDDAVGGGAADASCFVAAQRSLNDEGACGADVICGAGTFACELECVTPCNGTVECPDSVPFPDEGSSACGASPTTSAIAVSATTAEPAQFALSARRGELYAVARDPGGDQRVTVTRLGPMPSQSILELVGPASDGELHSVAYRPSDGRLYLLDVRENQARHWFPRRRVLRLASAGPAGDYVVHARVPYFGLFSRLHLLSTPTGRLIIAASTDLRVGKTLFWEVDPGRPAIRSRGSDATGPIMVSDPGEPARIVGIARASQRGRLTRKPGVGDGYISAVLTTRRAGEQVHEFSLSDLRRVNIELERHRMR